jgi:hypothetical protein
MRVKKKKDTQAPNRKVWRDPATTTTTTRTGEQGKRKEKYSRPAAVSTPRPLLAVLDIEDEKPASSEVLGTLGGFGIGGVDNGPKEVWRLGKKWESGRRQKRRWEVQTVR